MTKDDNVFILGPLPQRLAKALVLVAAALIILTPTLVLPSISTTSGRMVASMFSAVVFLSVISCFTGARTVDVFASGARYDLLSRSRNGSGELCL